MDIYIHLDIYIPVHSRMRNHGWLFWDGVTGMVSMGWCVWDGVCLRDVSGMGSGMGCLGWGVWGCVAGMVRMGWPTGSVCGGVWVV